MWQIIRMRFHCAGKFTKQILLPFETVLILNTNLNIFFCRDEVAKELRHALSHIKLSSEGVYVQASTLGSLEALLEFLKTSKIPVCSQINIISSLLFIRLLYELNYIYQSLLRVPVV